MTENLPPELAWPAGVVLLVVWLIVRARQARQHIDVMIQWGRGAGDGDQ
jgi:hypothetical protein